MEIRHHRDVYAKPPEYRKPGRLHVDCPGIRELLVEMRVEVADRDLVARQFLVPVIVCVPQDRGMCSCGAFGTQIEIDRHPLPCSGRSIVEREISACETARLPRAPVPHLVADAMRPVLLFAFRLPDADAHQIIFGLPVIHIPEIEFNFTSPEELVRRRENGQRPSASLENRCAVARTNGDGIGVRIAAEPVLLPRSRHVEPREACAIRQAHSAEACTVLIRDRRLVGLRNRLLPKEIAAPVHRKRKPPGEDAGSPSVKRDLQP
jgi:hypothetical protein